MRDTDLQAMPDLQRGDLILHDLGKFVQGRFLYKDSIRADTHLSRRTELVGYQGY